MRHSRGVPRRPRLAVLDFAENTAVAWYTAGGRSPTPPSRHAQGGCTAPDCRGLAFAEIATATGQQALCLRHFEAVEACFDHSGEE